MNEQETADGSGIVEGAISVLAVLESGSRPVAWVAVDAERIDRAIQRIVGLATSHKVAVRKQSAAEVDALATGKSHGGVIAEVGARRFAALQELASPAGQRTIVMLDGIEDPFNFGSALRSLWAAGIDGVVVRQRNWLSAAGVVARASAGASERMPVAVVDSAEEAATALRTLGYTIACADESPAAMPMQYADLGGRLFLLIGGEKRGVTRSFLDQADVVVRIPYGRRTPIALDTASATAVIAFEVSRQRAALIRPRERRTP